MTVISKKEKWIKKRNRQSYKINMHSKHPVLIIFRSNRNISLQLIDNDSKNTICSSSSLDNLISKEISKADSKVDMSKIVANHLAKKLKEKKIENIVFNRSGYRYHGRVKVVAETLRENGIIL